MMQKNRTGDQPMTERWTPKRKREVATQYAHGLVTLRQLQDEHGITESEIVSWCARIQEGVSLKTTERFRPVVGIS